MRIRTCSALAASLFSFTLVACGPAGGPNRGDDTGGDDTGGDDEGPRPDADDTPVSTQRCQKMDIVFVVDDSYSMVEEQSNLATNFPQFANVLDQYEVEPGLPLDYRVAVTSTGRDVTYTQVVPLPPPIGTQTVGPLTEEGFDGAFQQRCSMSRKWLEKGDPNLASTFACAAQLGTDGPGWEMQLHASELALGARVADGTNAGFLRDDALLAVVYLTDEDDCSRRDNNFTHDATTPCTNEPVSQWVDFFDDLKGARGRWATAVIAGPTDCESDFGEAARATRMMEFVNLAGTNAVFSSICEGNLSGALEDALNTFTAACETFPDID